MDRIGPQPGSRSPRSRATPPRLTFRSGPCPVPRGVPIRGTHHRHFHKVKNRTTRRAFVSLALRSSMVALAASRAQPAFARLDGTPPAILDDGDLWVRLEPDAVGTPLVVVGRGTEAVLAS